MPEAIQETTKKTARRKTKAKPKLKSYSPEEVDELISKATKRAEEKIAQKMEELQMKKDFDISNDADNTNFESGGVFAEPYHELPGMDGEALDTLGTEEALNAFDLFEHIQSHYTKAGTPVKYQVKKDGTLLGEISHPCSWTKIQKKWGEGHYTVAAKKRTDNTYIKQQTLDLGPADEPEEEAKNRIEDQIAALALQNHSTPAPAFDMTSIMTQMMTSFQKMQEMNHTDKKTEERDNKKADSQFNTTMLTLMQGQQSASQTMFMEMNKSTQAILEKMQENTIRSQEKMDDKFTRIFEKMSDQANKKENFGTMEIMKMMKDAEDQGWSKMQMLMDLVEAKSADKESEGGGSDGMIGKLITGILPLLTGAQQQQAMVLNQQQQRRGQLPSAQPSPQAQPRVRASSPQTQRPNQRSSNPQSFTQKIPVGVPGLNFDEPVQAKPTGGAASVEPREVEAEVIEENKNPSQVGPTENKAKETIENLIADANPVQRSLAEICIPIIANGLMSNQDPRQNADESLNMVWRQMQLGPAEMMENFSFDFLLRIAGAFGIGQESLPWFKEFYAHIEDKAGMDVKGTDEFTESPESSIGIW